MDRMYAVIRIQLDNKYPEKQQVTGISMRIRYKNQELVIVAMKMGMRLIGWKGDLAVNGVGWYIGLSFSSRSHPTR